MDIYEENVLNWGMKPIIESVEEIKLIHNRR